jgi:hypothetical protein
MMMVINYLQNTKCSSHLYFLKRHMPMSGLESTLRFLDDFDTEDTPIYLQEALNSEFDSWPAGISFNATIR